MVPKYCSQNKLWIIGATFTPDLHPNDTSFLFTLTSVVLSSPTKTCRSPIIRPTFKIGPKFQGPETTIFFFFFEYTRNNNFRKNSVGRICAEAVEVYFPRFLFGHGKGIELCSMKIMSECCYNYKLIFLKKLYYICIFICHLIPQRSTPPPYHLIYVSCTFSLSKVVFFFLVFLISVGTVGFNFPNFWWPTAPIQHHGRPFFLHFHHTNNDK